MTKVVIIGAGYGGILAALGLSRNFRNDKNTTITLIDRYDYQLFASNLYEVATAEEELTSVNQLKRSIVIPLKEIFQGSGVKVMKAEVAEIDRLQKTVTAGITKVPYDYLLLATGSQTDYFNIEGAEKFAQPMKTLTDALAIRNKIEFAIQAHRLDVNKKNIRIVVAGGGYTGVELVAELSHEIELLTWKNQYPREKIEITVVEAMNQLIPGLSDRLSKDALWKLKDRGVRVQLSSPIFKVDEHFVEMASGEKMEYDVLVWTTGVRAATLPFTQPVNTDKKGRIVTNEFLQSIDDDKIFALGDAACVLNADGKPAPPTAQDAEAHGIYAAYALPCIMRNKKPASYKGKRHGFIVTVGGESAILNYGGFYFKGSLAYLVRELAHLNYYRKVVGWWKAIRYIWFQVGLYSRND